MSSNVQLRIGSSSSQVFHMDGTLSFTLDTNNRGSGSVSFQSTKSNPVTGTEIGIYWIGTRIFGGTLETVARSRASARSTAQSTLACTFTSWEHRLAEIRVQCIVVSGMDAGDLFQHIVTTYAAGEGFTFLDIRTGALAAALGQIKYEAVSVSDILDDLAVRSNFVWGSTPDKGLYYRSKALTSTSALALTNASKNIVQHSSTETREDYVNGGQIRVSWAGIPSETSGVLHGNGVIRTFNIPDVAGIPQLVDHIDKILLGGVEATFGILNIDTDKQFYYDPGSKTITQDVAEPVLTSADSLEIFYWILGRNIITYEDTAEIAARAAIEGSSGRYEVFLDDSNNISQVGALNKLKAYISKRAPGRNGAAAGTMPRVHVIEVWSYVANAVVDLVPGEVITINDLNPTTGGVLSLLVQSIQVNEIAAFNVTGRGILKYTVNAVDYIRVDDFVDFFKGLAAGGGSITGSGGSISGGGGGTGGGGTAGGMYTVPVVAGVATPNPALGKIQKIIITGATTIAAPSGTPVDGDEMILWIIQDAITGGFFPTFDAIYKLGDFAIIDVQLGRYNALSMFFDTANWYVKSQVLGQTL